MLSNFTKYNKYINIVKYQYILKLLFLFYLFYSCEVKAEFSATKTLLNIIVETLIELWNTFFSGFCD